MRSAGSRRPARITCIADSTVRDFGRRPTTTTGSGTFRRELSRWLRSVCKQAAAVRSADAETATQALLELYAFAQEVRI